jgi:hypothetical protein
MAVAYMFDCVLMYVVQKPAWDCAGKPILSNDMIDVRHVDFQVDNLNTFKID